MFAKKNSVCIRGAWKERPSIQNLWERTLVAIPRDPLKEKRKGSLKGLEKMHLKANPSARTKHLNVDHHLGVVTKKKKKGSVQGISQTELRKQGRTDDLGSVSVRLESRKCRFAVVVQYSGSHDSKSRERRRPAKKPSSGDGAVGRFQEVHAATLSKRPPEPL